MNRHDRKRARRAMRAAFDKLEREGGYVDLGAVAESQAFFGRQHAEALNTPRPFGVSVQWGEVCR